MSIDSASTRDVDDAFFVQSDGTGCSLTLALACPALLWPFGGSLDKAVLHRGTSIYLPEGTCHMLPETLGTGAFSLLAGEPRPALCVRVPVDSEGQAGACEVFVARARLAANLTYKDSQAVLDALATQGRRGGGSAGQPRRAPCGAAAPGPGSGPAAAEGAHRGRSRDHGSARPGDPPGR